LRTIRWNDLLGVSSETRWQIDANYGVPFYAQISGQIIVSAKEPLVPGGFQSGDCWIPQAVAYGTISTSTTPMLGIRSPLRKRWYAPWMTSFARARSVKWGLSDVPAWYAARAQTLLRALDGLGFRLALEWTRNAAAFGPFSRPTRDRQSAGQLHHGSTRSLEW